jgi:glucose dehydrogenase
MQIWAVVARQTAEEHSLKHRLACAEDRFWPCQQPPWGQLWAINVNTGDIAWKVPFRTAPELDAKGVHNTGSLNYGGSISTGGGLVFIAASNDQHFRAYEAATGKILWDIQMDTGAYVTPSTFMGKDGKQYVVIVDTVRQLLRGPTGIRSSLSRSLRSRRW